MNDEQEFNEALSYIEALNVPEGYQMDMIAVREAPSMAAGYNAAMRETIVLKELELICRIRASEETLGLDAGIYRENMPHQEVYARLNRLRHLIKRIEFRHGNSGEIFRELSENYSTCAVTAVVLTYGM